MQPMVTVVTPAFNAEACIGRCVASVAAQEYSGAIEHLVIDGGSRDRTAAVATAAGARVLSEPDAGIYDAMAKGARLARGEYVHILNADDAYADESVLERIIARMEVDDLDIAHGKAAQVDGAGAVVRVFGRDATKSDLLRKMRVAHPTMVVRRSVYERFGGFSQGFRIAGDHEWVLRVWDRVRIGFIDQVLVRMACGGVSTTEANCARAYRESMAAAVMHGAPPFSAATRCWYEIVKHRLVFARRFRAAAARAPLAASGAA